MITLTSPHARVTVSPYGGQVMSCIPLTNEQEGPDLLWQTTPPFLQKAQDNHKALRGGIPLCWPWFLANPTHAESPSHGLARISMWDVTAQTPTTATLTFATNGTHPGFPHIARATLHVEVSTSLTVTLTTHNAGPTPFRLTQALHTYLNVGNAATCTLTGLSGSPCRHVSHGTPYAPLTGPLHGITTEVETLFTALQSPVEITAPALNRRIHVALHGTTEAVLWNPGPTKAQSLDMPPEAYPQFLCLEAAHIDSAPTLAPGQTAKIGTTLSFSPLPSP